ncbi:Transcriptional regulator [Knufia obscura]|uniref:Transcriptional regulator n=2 Tax=Knufia TaxID=430999 RepID=A0AAN8EKD7_9EURO|nr:Transcriptional regulator [Knufia obscura]KAK5952797.1 Transcriptional regulator [Knufia fluminis]
MPPLGSASKSKNKHAKEARHSRSRNTTPSSVLSATAAPTGTTPSTTPFLQLDTSKLLVASQPNYAEILDRLETKPANLDPKQLQDVIEQLKQLSDSAEKRIDSCEKAIRLIHDQLKDLDVEHKERERQVEHAKKLKAKKDESSSQKNLKAKKRKDREVGEVEIKREDDTKSKLGRASETPGPRDTPSPSKKIKHSPGTSSLSEVATSPKAASDPRASPAQSDESMEENRVVHKPPPVPAQGFFPDPLAPDPIIYHIRDVTPDMPDEEKKEIYSVTSYPTVDLSDQIAGGGIIPDKDFSNARPQNQIAANTFQTFVEPYVKPLAEEDMAFLRERGDRVTPFLPIPRGKRNWEEIWAEEDGKMITDQMDRLSTTQPRGNLDDIDEDNVHTDQVSSGPLASRLMSLLKYEHRSPLNDINGNDLNAFTDGNDTMDLDGLTNGNENERPQASATSIADLAGGRSAQKLDYVQSDERIKSELRYLGLLGQEENPDYDAHNDDGIAERLRLLQAELRRVMLVNGARKARLLDLAKERLAYQEYSTIHDDLDSQVQQAYLKRTRTLGKTKKGGPGGNKPKPGLASMNLSINRARDIGDNARMLMDRRKRWQNCIGPVFKDMKHGIPRKDETIWEPKLMESYEKAELEAMEEEGE